MILDIGSAGGPLFASTSLDVTYYDVDLYRMKNFVRGIAERLPFRDRSFTVCVLADVLEHVSDPVEAVKEAKRVGRRVLITVPHEKYEQPFVYSKSREEHRVEVDKWAEVNRPAQMVDDAVHPHLFHQRRFSHEGLKQLFSDAGLRVEISFLQLPNDPWFHGHWLIVGHSRES